MHHGVTEEYDTSCTVVSFRFHIVQHVAGSWMRIFLWRSETSQGSEIQQGRCIVFYENFIDLMNDIFEGKLNLVSA